jgi:nucleoid-associated protein YgaU
MGLFDLIKNALGGKSEKEVTVSPSRLQRETGIDPDKMTAAAAAPEAPAEAPVAAETEAESPAPAEAPSDVRNYTVKSGDTLWKIAEQMYGNGSSYMKIFVANTDLLDNPDQIFPSQELTIPKLEE